MRKRLPSLGVLAIVGVVGVLGVVSASSAALFSASVRASADTHLRVSRLRRSAFLTAVTGYPAAAAAGEDLVRGRLEADAERFDSTGR